MTNREQGASSEGLIRRKEQEPIPFKGTIIALDVDGVLVQPLAYRQAINRTLGFFGRQLKVDAKELMLDEQNTNFGGSMSHFEANGIHDPWDVSAIIVSLMQLRKAGVDISAGEALKIYQDNPDKKKHPPEVVLEELNKRYSETNPDAMEEVAKSLAETRDPLANNITSIFQEYVLGKERFEEAYGKKSQTGVVRPLIQTEDNLLLNETGSKTIKTISDAGGKVVIYTGRPGLPPKDAKRTVGDGYSPEAELAVEKTQIEALGMVTMGSMQWLGRETDTPLQSLTKPNPTQALAAILSALRGKTDSKLLKDAYEWDKKGKIPLEIKRLLEAQPKIEIVVVEDSLSGVIAFVNAKKTLDNFGFQTKLTAIGVHGGDQEKFKTFKDLAEKEQIDVVTCTTLNEGLTEYYLNVLRESKKEGAAS